MKNEKLMAYLKEGVSPFHLVSRCEKDLVVAGFMPLAMDEDWALEAGGKYYVMHHGTTILAFVVPEIETMKTTDNSLALRIAAAHTDFPCLRIKTNPDMKQKSYLKVNTEVYGGAILNTWLDRPLGVAGRVALASDQVFEPEMRFYDSKRPIFTIPNLAIHMNREINKGVELNKQTDLIPLFGLEDEGWDFMTFLAQELGVEKEEILDFELYVYNAEDPCYVGGKEELLSASRIDNISSCCAIIESLEQLSDESTNKKLSNLSLGVCFDHEEIGSHTKQGAGSALLTDVIEKIYLSMGLSLQQAKDAIYQGMMFSVDVAHAMHPNHPEKNDVTNEPVLNGGFVMKEAASQSYATDSQAIAMVMQLAKKHDIVFQKYVNRSDVAGGGTLGAIASALLPMRTVDMGVPMLAMHSARELMGESDYASLQKIICALYKA